MHTHVSSRAPSAPLGFARNLRKPVFALLTALALVLTPTRVQAANPASTTTEGPRQAPMVELRSRTSGCRQSPSCVRIAALSGVTGGLGLTATIVGATLLAKPDRVDPEMPLHVRSYARPGIITLSLGISVLATSLVMALAAARAARHRRHATARRSTKRLSNVSNRDLPNVYPVARE